MPRSKTTGPTERELDILRVLWACGSCCVREVHGLLQDKLALSFTTVQTMLQVMFDKGLVERELKGRSHIYRASVSQEAAEKEIVGDVLERVFGGSAKQLLARALDVKKASKKELEDIQRLIEQAKKSRK